MVPREAGTKERLEMDSLEQVYDRLDKMHTALSAAGSGEAYDVGLMDGIAVARQYVRRAMVEASRRTEAEAEAIWPGIGAEVDERRRPTMATETTTEATPRAGSCWALRTGKRVDRWPDDNGPVGAQCEHCRYVILCADRTATWIHNDSRDARCNPYAVIEAST